jgi:uncharacterized membrane protein
MTTDQRAGSARRIPQLIPHRLLRSKPAHHPAVLEEAERRSRNFQLRLADRITTFAGSMNFVWIHAALFAVWMLFLEKSPWPSLTLVVSLEAIFLSTFVMIGQNRQAAFQQAKADHDFEAQDLELKTNTDLTRQIHLLTVELHRRLIDRPASDLPDPASATSDGYAPRAQGTVRRGPSGQETVLRGHGDPGSTAPGLGFRHADSWRRDYRLRATD